MAVNEHQKFKIHNRVDIILSTILLIGCVYLLPAVCFITAVFFKDMVFGQTNLSQIHDWGSLVLRISNDFWLSVIHRILSLFGSTAR